MTKKTWRAAGRSLLWNLLAGVVGILPFMFGSGDWAFTWGFALIIIAVISLFAQFIIALTYLQKPLKKEIGQGWLLSIGLFVLIGLGICGPMWLGF